MKKIMFILLLAVGVSLNGFAQKGMCGVGAFATLSIPANNSGHYTGKTTWAPGVKFQYWLSDHFRVEPAVAFFQSPSGDDYYPNSHFYMNDFNARLAVHYVITKTLLKPYIIGHLNYGKVALLKDDRFGFGGGVGLDYRFTYNFAVQLELTATMFNGNDRYEHSYSCPPFITPSLGLTYNF